MRYRWGSALLQLAENELLLWREEGENHLLKVQRQSAVQSLLSCPLNSWNYFDIVLSLIAGSMWVKAQLHSKHWRVRVSSPLNGKYKSWSQSPQLCLWGKEWLQGWKMLQRYHSASATPAVLKQDNINSPIALHVQNFKCFQTPSRPNVFTEIGCLLPAHKKEGERKD